MISDTSGDVRCNIFNWVDFAHQAIFEILPPILISILLYDDPNVPRKIEITILFSFGLPFLVITFFRTHWSHLTLTNPDFSWNYSGVVLWPMAQILSAHISATFGIIAKPLWKELRRTQCFTRVLKAGNNIQISDEWGGRTVDMKSIACSGDDQYVPFPSSTRRFILIEIAQLNSSLLSILLQSRVTIKPPKSFL
jgi:hypothetical protein